MREEDIVDKTRNPNWSSEINNEFFGLRYSEFICPVIKAIQELDGSGTSVTADHVGLDATEHVTAVNGNSTGRTAYASGIIEKYTAKSQIYVGQPVALSIHSSGIIKVDAVISGTTIWEIVGIAIEDAAINAEVSVCTSGFTTARTVTLKGGALATIGAPLYTDVSDYTRVTESAGSGAIAIGYVAATSTANDSIFMRFQK